jgi:acyl dehydratase
VPATPTSLRPAPGSSATGGSPGTVGAASNAPVPAGLAGLAPGAALPAQTYQVTRADLVRYTGASLDFNPIHWSDRVATKVGLPGVIAHGMYTMALVGRALTTWAGDPAAVRDFNVRFTRPVLVPDDDMGAEVVVSGVVRKPTGDGGLHIEVTASSAGERVLGQARAVLRVADGGSRATGAGGGNG